MNETTQALVFGALGGFLVTMAAALARACWRARVRRARRNACRQRLPSEDWD